MNAYNYNIQNQCLQYGKKKLLVSSLNFMKNLDIQGISIAYILISFTYIIILLYIRLIIPSDYLIQKEIAALISRLMVTRK